MIELGNVNRRCREVPHELIQELMRRRIDICEKLLRYSKDERFLRQIVTCDEKWLYYRYLDTNNQWIDKRSQTEAVVKHGRFEKKSLLCVWWNYEGGVHFELLPEGQTIHSEVYCFQLQRVYDILYRRYPAMVNRKRVIIQHDNARLHTSRKAREKIKDLEISVLPHPAYSPDLAHSDYYLFRSMAHFLGGWCFQSAE